MLRAVCSAPALRFAVVGLTMTGLHLTLFQLLVAGSVPEVANAVAFLVVTQVNFALSYSWTWASRRPAGRHPAPALVRRAALFTGSALVGLAMNTVVLSIAHRIGGLPALHSAVVATAASAVTNFVLASRVVFARRGVPEAALRSLRPGSVPQLDAVRAAS